MYSRSDLCIKTLWATVAIAASIFATSLVLFLTSTEATADTPHREIRVAGSVCANGAYSLNYSLYRDGVYLDTIGIVRYSGDLAANPHTTNACQIDAVGGTCSSAWYQDGLTSNQIMNNLRTRYNIE